SPHEYPSRSCICPPQLSTVAIRHFHSFFFFNDTATTEIYTLSLHDALPIYLNLYQFHAITKVWGGNKTKQRRSEEHTSELQSHLNLVCRLLLEKKKNKK